MSYFDGQTDENKIEKERIDVYIPVIRLKNVDIFQQKILILSDVSFTVNKGEFVYMVGKTGSGKSNLLKLMYGDIVPASGEIEVVGYDMCKIKAKNIQRLRRKLGIVFQDYQLLQDRSVYENLKFVTQVTGWKDKKLRDERITEVLEMVDLKTKGHKFPHQLSGGEQQRVCIARALINNPEIILADEPTGNLDPESSYDIFNLFKQISEKGTAVLVATHDFLIINQIPSRVIQIIDGKIVE
jgi:cell division transport system ATP-binding protein